MGGVIQPQCKRDGHIRGYGIGAHHHPAIHVGNPDGHAHHSDAQPDRHHRVAIRRAYAERVDVDVPK